MWDIGDTVPLGVLITDQNGNPANAGTIALTVTREFDAQVDTPTPSNTAAGRYAYDYVTTVPGRHVVRWTSTSPAAAFTDAFDVSSAPQGIVSLTQAKTRLKLPLAVHTSDEELRTVIGGTTLVIEDIVGCVIRRTVVEKHSGNGAQLALNRFPIRRIVSVTENGVTLTEDSGFSLDDYGILWRVAGYHARRWACGINNIVVTYEVGRSEVKDAYLEAAYELIRINFRPVQGGNYTPFDTSGEGDSEGGLWRLGYFVPHGVMRMLSADQRPPGSA